MNCIKCNNIIAEGRLKAIPSATTCVNCSSTDRYGSFQVVNHKTGNEIQIIKDRKLAEKINYQAKRRNYGVSNGVRMSLK